MSSLYQYQPLDLRERRFRLLTISRGQTDLIKCTLSIVPLSFDHVCLSYRWCSDAPTKTIKVNGADFSVKSNVWDFLFLARQKYPAKRFWIDAICINQSDVAEKNHQVPHMGSIYSHASEVIVWLWPDTANLRSAISSIRSKTLPVMLVPHKIGEPWYLGNSATIPLLLVDTTSSSVVKPTAWSISSQLIRTAARTFWIGESSRIAKVRKNMEDLEAFFTNSYWRRAWIVQEILSNKHARIVVGDLEINWDKVAEYSNAWSRVSHSWEHGIIHNNFDIINSWPFRGIDFSIEDKPFVDLFQLFSTQDCDDFHDNIYSLRALAKDRDRISIDYGSTEEDFLLRVLPCVRACAIKACFFDGFIGPFSKLKVLENLRRRSVLPPPDRFGKWSLDWYSHEFSFDSIPAPYLIFPPEIVRTCSMSTAPQYAEVEEHIFNEHSEWNKKRLQQLLDGWSSRGVILRLHNHAYFLFSAVSPTVMQCTELALPYRLDQSVPWKGRTTFSASQSSGILARQVNKFIDYDGEASWQIELTRGAAVRLFMVAECKERSQCNIQDCSRYYFVETMG